MNITFPTDKLEDKKFDFRSQYGNFLIGDDNTWHGGIHIEGKDTPIKAIADGRIIAYRFEEEYKKIVKNKGTDTEHLCKYSNCFMLIQHDFELVKHITKNKGTKEETTEKKAENITFYSLYNHILPLDKLESSISDKIKVPDFMSAKKTQVTANEVMKGLEAYPVKDKNTRDIANLVFLPYGDQFELATDTVEGLPNTMDFNDRSSIYVRIKYKNHNNIYIHPSSSLKKKVSGNTYSVKTQTDTKDKDIKGAQVKEAGNPTSKILKIITNGTTVEIDQEKSSGNWLKLKDQEGYVRKGSVKERNVLDKSKIITNSIEACDIPIKRDKLIGYTGLKQSKAAGDDYYVCHHEIFMANDDEDTITNFLNDTFDIHSEEEKPLDKKKYYTLPKDAILYKSLKVPGNSTIKAKTPVKVIAKKDKFCKIKILDKVERVVEKGALAVNNTKSKGKKIVYDIVNFDYISKMFDGTVSKKDTLIYKEDVKNTLVKVSYEPEEVYIDYDFWIPFSDLSKNYEFEEKSKTVKVYKSVQNAESFTNYVMAPKSEPIDNVRVDLNFVRDIHSNGEEKAPEAVGRKNVTKKTYQVEEEKELLKFVPHQLLVDAGATYVKSANSNQKKGGVKTGYYPVTATKIDSFNKINKIFEGKLSATEMSPLFYTAPGLNCNAEGKSGTTHRRVTHVYKETIEKNIVPNIIHEDENVIQAVLPVEVYKKFEIQAYPPKVYVDNTGEDPKVHEDVDTLFVFFENKLPNVSGFELKWIKACDAEGTAKNWRTASHRLVEFNIEEFNKKQEVQSHKLLGGYTPKVGDEVGLVKDVTDIWMARPENKNDVDYTLEKETIVKLTDAKDIVLGEERGDFHYKQVKTHNLYLGNDNENVQTGWVKIEEFKNDKFFSPYNWEQFGFNILDAGNEYIYEIKGTLDHTDTKSEFIKKIWENFNILGAVIDASEVRFALGLSEVRYEMSRVVAKHKSEWSYDYDEVKADVEKFYDAQISLAKENKREQAIIDDMENLKQEYLSSLEMQVTDLMFWGDAAKPYSPAVTEKKEEKKKTKLDFGNTDADRKEFGTPAAVTTPTTTTTTVATTTAPTETKKEAPKKPERIFPNTENIYHFHPIAFINQMKLMFEQGNEGGICKEEARVRAFMRMLRIGEGTKDEKGYERIVGGTHFSDHGKDFSNHPNVKVYIPSIDDYSYAAGAYQITKTNWNDTAFVNWRKKQELSDFSPESQDKYCVYLIAGKKKSLDLIKQGNITEAIQKCRKEWASLPGSGHGQREENLFEILAEYTKYYKEELNGITSLKMPWGTVKKLGYDCCNNVVTDTNCGKENIDLSNKVPWMSQFNKDEKGNKKGCWRTSQKILVKSGLRALAGYKDGMIVTATEDSANKTVTITTDAKKGVDYIDSELEKGNPILVGLHYWFGNIENDKTTDHFFVIIGRGCDNEKRFFSFYEVGTNYGDKGIHPTNKLYLGDDYSLRGTAKHDPSHKYVVSQVRKN